jgi:type IV secretory pathway VirB2 component (pilin)
MPVPQWINNKLQIYKEIKATIWKILILTPITRPTFAASTGPAMPWDNGLAQIQNALTGNTAHALIVLAIAITGIAVALGEHDSIFRKAASIVFGGSIAVGAVSLYSTLRFSGAVIG